MISNLEVERDKEIAAIVKGMNASNGSLQYVNDLLREVMSPLRRSPCDEKLVAQLKSWWTYFTNEDNRLRITNLVKQWKTARDRHDDQALLGRYNEYQQGDYPNLRNLLSPEFNEELTALILLSKRIQD